MNTTFRKLFTTVTLLLVLTLSAFITIPVYADEAAPEETIEVTEQTSTEEEATQSESVEEETTPPSDVETESATETSDSSETAETILESLPEDTQLVVLDEEGEALSLATEEAAQAVIVGDPIWCPATVKVPTPLLNGCSDSYGSFSALFTDPIFSGTGPAKDGIIWVESSYVGEANTIDIGSALVSTTLKDFKLTINGGWDGTTGTLDPNAPSTFTTPLIITGWNNDVTINNISIVGSNEGALYSLHVETSKNITLNNVEVSTTTDGGAWLDNDMIGGTGNVTVTNSEFNDIADANGGLRIDSKGTVTLKNVEANNNGTGGSGIGILIYNTNADTPKNVTLTNVSVEDNQNNGLVVNSKGLITITDVTAIGNGYNGGGDGVTLSNTAGTAGVTLNGTNLFYDNDDYGLIINSKGAVKASNLHAINNGIHGVYIINNSAATPQSVTITGSNTFKFNGSQGLSVLSLGQITANNLTANSNNSIGVQLTNSAGPDTSGVTLTGTNQFNSNNNIGLDILTKGAVTLNTLTANENANDGVSINNTFSTTFKGVTLNGVNIFEGNGGTGLDITSDGIVTLNNINANQNHGFSGLFIDNNDSTPATPKAITIKGNNTISNNDGYGFYIQSHGTVTINNMIANYNGLVDSSGYNFIDNASSSTKPAAVTFTGTSQFIGNYNNGLYISSIGLIKLNNITVNDSVATGGAYISNAIGSATADVILTGKNIFTGNQGTNLQIFSFGAITLNNITASEGGSGANLNNTGSTKPKGVTLTGTNIFTNNVGSGLFISSQGVVTLNNITANNNGTGGSGGGVAINNSTAPTPAGVTINGTNNFNDNAGTGLDINSDGNIKANNITANGSVNGLTYGANFGTTSLGAIGGVTLTGKNTFIGNNNTNLRINSYGAVSLSNVTASNSQNFEGVSINNTYAGETAPKPVTLTGVNVFENNFRAGLNINSYGAVTTNSITATGNGFGLVGNGVSIGNPNNIVPVGVTMNGTNNISGNKDDNLSINSYGAVKINNLTADNSNSNTGASILNDGGSFFSNVTLTGKNSFNGNGALYGLNIQSKGVISLSNITASNNTGIGVYIVHTGTTETVTTKPITISGYLIANDNTNRGVEIQTYNQVTLNNITANDNGSTGVQINQSHVASTTPTNLTINGFNTFNGNSGHGLFIETLGNVTLNNVTASNNSLYGLYIDTNNMNAIGNVTLKGNNTFIGNNNYGIAIYTYGTVLANNVTASDTVVNHGVLIDNTYGSVPKSVTFTGTNTFNNSGGTGLIITSFGTITLSNITANDNSSYGANLTNTSASAANVTLTGKNQFNENGTTGLLVNSQGNITVSNITAYGNSSHGAELNNNTGTSTTKVTITGVNSFSENTNAGLFINTLGTATLTKITADGNGGSGALINIASGGNISLTCGSFVNNAFGLNFNTPGAVVTLKGVVAVGNGMNYSLTTISTTQTHGCPLP